MFARTLAGAALAVCLSMQVAAEDAKLDTVVATVGETEITLGEMLVARTQLPPQFQQIPAEQLFEGVLTQLIQQQLLSDSLSAEPPRIELAIRQEARALRAGEAVNALATSKVTEEAVQAAYDQIAADLQTGTEYHAAHILVETEDEAKTILEELLAGADFAETAKEKSTGPSGPSGGDLGWFGAGMMVPEFEEATVALDKGELSDPVQTQFGWHIIKLLDTRDESIPTLEELRGEIESELLREAIDVRIAELESSAEVTRVEGIDPAMMGQTELLDAE